MIFCGVFNKINGRNIIKCYAAVKNSMLFTGLLSPKDNKETGKLVMCLLNYLQITL